MEYVGNRPAIPPLTLLPDKFERDFRIHPKGEFPFLAGESVIGLPVPRTVQERSFFIGELEGLIDWKSFVDDRIGQRHGSLFVAECRGLNKWPRERPAQCTRLSEGY